MLATERLGSGPPLVLVHGWGMNGGVWTPMRERLAARWQVTSIELPGHGHSAFDDGLTTIDAWADALLAAAPERAVWLGWSLGGQLSLAAARRAPDRVRALVPTTTNPRFVRGSDWPAAMDPETFHAFAGQLQANARRTLDRFLALQVRGAHGAGDTLRALRTAIRARPVPHPQALQAGLQLLLNTDLRSSIANMGVPSLWLFGGRDALVPAAASEAVKALMPTARVQVIDQAGHAPFLSHPDSCLDQLNQFSASWDD